MASLVFPLLLILALYFFFVTPQRRRAQAQRAAKATVDVGDRVVTAGGMIGTLHAIDSQRGVVEIAPGVFIEVLAQAVLRGVDPATDGADDADEVEADPAIRDDDTVPMGVVPMEPPQVETGHDGAAAIEASPREAGQDDAAAIEASPREAGQDAGPVPGHEADKTDEIAHDEPDVAGERGDLT